MEKEHHEKIFGIIIYIIHYLATFWAMLFYPKRTLSKINSSDLIRPGAFLFTNILLSLSVAQFLGYEIEQFPINNRLIQILIGNSYILIRFLLGLSIFLLLLKKFMKWKKLNTFIKLVLPILCYCSVLYLPIILVKQSFYYYISDDLLNIFSRAIVGLPIKVSIHTYLKFLLFFMIPLIFLFWWLRLIYLGINSLKIDSSVKTKRVIVFSYLLFFIFQIVISLALFLKINYPTYKSFLIIRDDKVGEELSLNPPNYYKAKVLASEVSENEYMPNYIRYIYKLEKIICEIGFSKGNEKLISEGLRGLGDRNYDHVLDILIEDFKRSSNKNNYYRTVIGKDIEGALKLRNSQSFFDFRKENINSLVFSWSTIYSFKPFHVIMFEQGEKNFHVMAPIPRVISLFP